MTDIRKPIFDAIRTAKGAGLMQSQVNEINATLDSVGVPKDSPVYFAMKNTDAFFKGIRDITGSLDQVRVDVINDLLARATSWPAAYLAYGLATAWHESRLKPIEEIGKGKGHDYGVIDETGKAPYGRGLVQLTWRKNYVNADAKLGLGGTLASNYDRALEADIASQILVQGMAEGWFTGKKLSDYITSGTHAEYVAARRIINGTDRADMIAGYADRFKSTIIAGEWS